MKPHFPPAGRLAACLLPFVDESVKFREIDAPPARWKPDDWQPSGTDEPINRVHGTVQQGRCVRDLAEPTFRLCSSLRCADGHPGISAGHPADKILRRAEPSGSGGTGRLAADRL